MRKTCYWGSYAFTLARLHPQIGRAIPGIVLILRRAIWHKITFRALPHSSWAKPHFSACPWKQPCAESFQETVMTTPSFLIFSQQEHQCSRTCSYWYGVRACGDPLRYREVFEGDRSLRLCAPYRVLQRSRQLNLYCTTLHICSLSRCLSFRLRRGLDRTVDFFRRG